MKPANDQRPPKGALSALFQSAAWKRTRSAFKLAAIYLVPPSAFWLNPFNHSNQPDRRSLFRAVAATGIVLAGHQIVHTSTGMLFPTGEDYLKSQGLDPALARQLSDNTIRVRQHDFAGRLHATNDMPALGVVFSALLVNTPGQAHALPNHGSVMNHMLRYTPLRDFVECPVMIQAPDTTARQMIGLLGNFPPDMIETIRTTDREMRLAVTFHEFRHCSSQNALGATLAEGDADGTGVVLLAKTLNNPEIARTFLYARALSLSTTSHDTALIMDAMMNGRPVPSNESAVLQPTADVFVLADLFKRQQMAHSTLPHPLRTAVALQHVMERHGELLSPRAKRRAEIYIEAVDYFMPDAWAKARQQPLSPPAPNGPR